MVVPVAVNVTERILHIWPKGSGLKQSTGQGSGQALQAGVLQVNQSRKGLALEVLPG